jgi:hypothetical protein
MLQEPDMRTHGTTLLLAFAALTAVACDGENRFRTGEANITGPSGQPVYEAVALAFDDNIGPTVDLLDEGAIFELQLDDTDMIFESRFRFGDIDFTTTGTFGVDEGVFTFSDDPFLDDTGITASSFDFEDAGDTLLLEGATVVLDANNDGFQEVGTLYLLLRLRE